MRDDKAELIYRKWSEKASLKRSPMFKLKPKGPNLEKKQPGKKWKE